MVISEILCASVLHVKNHHGLISPEELHLHTLKYVNTLQITATAFTEQLMPLIFLLKKKYRSYSNCCCYFHHLQDPVSKKPGVQCIFT